MSQIMRPPTVRNFWGKHMHVPRTSQRKEARLAWNLSHGNRTAFRVHKKIRQTVATGWLQPHIHRMVKLSYISPFLGLLIVHRTQGKNIVQIRSLSYTWQHWCGVMEGTACFRGRKWWFTKPRYLAVPRDCFKKRFRFCQEYWKAYKPLSLHLKCGFLMESCSQFRFWIEFGQFVNYSFDSVNIVWR